MSSCPHYYRFAKDGETEAGFCDRLIGEIEAVILREGPETVAAFIAEPVMGTGGVLVPPAGYFERLQALLDRHDILLIADEVITGFGRLGTWFATEFYGLKPDIVSVAKGITSAYFPMSASLISQRVWDVMERASPEVGPVMHGFTYSGHPVGAAMALANLAILEDEGMVANSASMGAYLKKGLKERVGDHPYVGDVRGQGLMIAVELSADKGKHAPSLALPERIDLWPTRRSRLASSCDLRRSSRRSLSRRRSASRRTSVIGRSTCSLTRSRRRRRSSMRWPSRGRPPERAQVELVSVGSLMDVLLGVDVGGTFTDFVAYDPESRAVSVWKVPSVPGDPVAGILDGISQEAASRGYSASELGTTVATERHPRAQGRDRRLRDHARLSRRPFHPTRQPQVPLRHELGEAEAAGEAPPLLRDHRADRRRG